jgi:hypothetical protein
MGDRPDHLRRRRTQDGLTRPLPPGRRTERRSQGGHTAQNLMLDDPSSDVIESFQAALVEFANS